LRRTGCSLAVTLQWPFSVRPMFWATDTYHSKHLHLTFKLSIQTPYLQVVQSSHWSVGYGLGFCCILPWGGSHIFQVLRILDYSITRHACAT
jgi:hypothetical protein